MAVSISGSSRGKILELLTPLLSDGDAMIAIRVRKNTERSAWLARYPLKPDRSILESMNEVGDWNLAMELWRLLDIPSGTLLRGFTKGREYGRSALPLIAQQAGVIEVATMRQWQVPNQWEISFG
jgi:hypothetical protein